MLVSLLNRGKRQDGAISSAYGCRGRESVVVLLFFAKDITSLFLLLFQVIVSMED